MFTPTDTELEEMNFMYMEVFHEWVFAVLIDSTTNVTISYNPTIETWRFTVWKIYPQSRKEIETLIRLFTK